MAVRMKVLVWQWGRRGAGPLCAVAFARELAGAGLDVELCLSAEAELVRSGLAPVGAWVEPTYRGLPSLLARLALAPWAIHRLARRLRAARPDAALCAMPAALDFVMASALRRAGVPFAVVVHDADPHPGETWLVQMRLQRALVRRAKAVVALSSHVAASLDRQGMLAGRALIRTAHPAFALGSAPPPFAHGGTPRLLSFGRLLPYKGLDLLAGAFAALPPGTAELRVVGSGPDSAELASLRALAGCTVENRWVPETEVAGLLAWADALVLPYREASQSGVAAAALALGRFVIATNVGGIAEQLAGEGLATLVAPDAVALTAAITGLAVARPAGVAPGAYDAAPLLKGLERIARAAPGDGPRAPATG